MTEGDIQVEKQESENVEDNKPKKEKERTNEA